MKPIRYWQNQKIYSWGCPHCEFVTMNWNIFWIHCKAEHDIKYGNRLDGLEKGQYIVKELVK